MSNILITGTTGLAAGLAEQLGLDHIVACVSRATGHDVQEIPQWGHKFLDFDIVINCAYSEQGQLAVLEYFYNHWKDDASKCIVNIGSRATYYPRLESEQDHKFWPYRLHKQCLELAWQKMVVSECMIKLINPGPIDTDLIRHIPNIKKMSVEIAAEKCCQAIFDPLVRRLDLWL